MQLVKITHNRGEEPGVESEFVLATGTEEEIAPKAERWAQYVLPVFEGLTLIAHDLEGATPSMTFAEGLSNTAYWVRLEIRS